MNFPKNEPRYKSLCYRIWRVLSQILTTTYPELNTQTAPFFVLGNSKIIGRLGMYVREDGIGNIVLYRLYRPMTHLITTSIHELAHHVDYCTRKKSDHSAEFYAVFASLLYTALDYSVIDRELLLSEELTGSDGGKVKTILANYTPTKRDPLFSEQKIIEVANSYALRELLQSRGYHFDPVKKTWYCECSSETAVAEVRYLSTLTTAHNIIVSNVSQVSGIDDKHIYIVLLERNEKEPIDTIVKKIEDDLVTFVTQYPRAALKPYKFEKNYFSLKSIYRSNFWTVRLSWQEAERLYRYFDTCYTWSRGPIGLTYYV